MTIYLKFVFIIKIICLIICDAFAQTDQAQLPKNEIRLNLETVIFQKLIETSGNPNSLFNSKNTPSGILSLSRYQRLKKFFLLESNIGFTIIPYNINYNIDLQTSHPLNNRYPNLDHSSYDFALPSIKSGLFFGKEFYSKYNFIYSISAGININIFPTFEFRNSTTYVVNNDNEDKSIRFFYLNLYDNSINNKIIWGNLSYLGRLGIINMKKKYQNLSVSLILNFQPNPIGYGKYYFDLGSHIETGTIKWNNNYLGLCFSKSFSKIKSD